MLLKIKIINQSTRSNDYNLKQVQKFLITQSQQTERIDLGKLNELEVIIKKAYNLFYQRISVYYTKKGKFLKSELLQLGTANQNNTIDKLIELRHNKGLLDNQFFNILIFPFDFSYIFSFISPTGRQKKVNKRWRNSKIM